MKPLYILLFLLFCVTINAQSTIDTIPVKIETPPTRLVIRCGTGKIAAPPLWVIDGVLVDPAQTRNLDPNDIESITILKDEAAAAIYHHRGSNGVVIVTTKNARLRQFSVKDLLDGNALAGATLTFISLENEKDNLRFAADENGMVETNLLKTGTDYKIIASSVGYKTLSVIYKIDAAKEINNLLLQKDVKENAPVTVVGYGARRVCCGLFYRITRWYDVALTNKSSLEGRIYPNPLRSGNAVKVEINMQEEKSLQLRITNLSGMAMASVPYRSFKGINRTELRTASQWAAGVYIVQVLDDKGKLLKQDKLLIQ